MSSLIDQKGNTLWLHAEENYFWLNEEQEKWDSFDNEAVRD